MSPDDQPPATWQREHTASETTEAVQGAFADPAFRTGELFCSLLKDPDVTAYELSHLVTPESLPAWGDFSSAIAWSRRMKGCAFLSNVDRALGDDAVAYFKVLPRTGNSYELTDAQILSGGTVLTLTNRGHGWRIHALGPYLHPEQVPH